MWSFFDSVSFGPVWERMPPERMRTLLVTILGAVPFSSNALSSTTPLAWMSIDSRMTTGESATNFAVPPAPALAVSDLNVIGDPAGSVAVTVSPSPAEITTAVSAPGTRPVDQLEPELNEPVVPPVQIATSVSKSQLTFPETPTLLVPAMIVAPPEASESATLTPDTL